jgi:hypothetical protein
MNQQKDQTKMNVNLSDSMIRVVRRVLEHYANSGHPTIEEGEPEVYPVTNDDALELFQELERALE